MEVDNGYYIDSWQYQATVHADNSWDVTETLTVTYREPRHGIYHYLCTYYEDQHPWQDQPAADYAYCLRVEDVDVEGYEYRLMDESDYYESKNIVIGDEDVVVTGQHTYVIHYKLRYHEDRCEEYDQLFHSVMAGNVTTDVGHFDFNLDFDKALPASVQQPGGLNIYGATYGSNKSVLDVQCQVTDHSISGSCDNIPAYHAVTLYSRLPEGYYESPLAETSTIFQGCYGLSLALMIYLVYDLLFCRHVQKAVPVVNFYPPKGVTSAEVGTIIDGTADTSDLLSLLPWLAQEGYLCITEIPDAKGRTGAYADIQLDLIKEPAPDALPSYIYLFMESLFGKGLVRKTALVSKLNDKDVEKIDKAKGLLHKIFTGDRALSRSHNRGFWLMLLAFMSGTISIFIASKVDTVRTTEAVLGIVYAFCSLITTVAVAAGANRRHLHSAGHEMISRLLVALGFAGVFGVGYMLLAPQNTFLTNEMLLILLILSSAVAMFSGRYIVDTPYRMEIMGQLLGLREFIRVAELPKLKMLVDEDPTYFYKVLPYAMAFGLTDKWGKQFASLDVQQPEWYHTNNSLNDSAMGLASMTHNISQSFTHISQQIAAQSLANQQASSGSSGGGFAGGGGGGGGTGSW